MCARWLVALGLAAAALAGASSLAGAADREVFENPTWTNTALGSTWAVLACEISSECRGDPLVAQWGSYARSFCRTPTTPLWTRSGSDRVYETFDPRGTITRGTAPGELWRGLDISVSRTGSGPGGRVFSKITCLSRALASVQVRFTASASRKRPPPRTQAQPRLIGIVVKGRIIMRGTPERLTGPGWSGPIFRDRQARGLTEIIITFWACRDAACKLKRIFRERIFLLMNDATAADLRRSGVRRRIAGGNARVVRSSLEACEVGTKATIATTRRDKGRRRGQRVKVEFCTATLNIVDGAGNNEAVVRWRARNFTAPA